MAVFIVSYGYNETDQRAARRDDHLAYLNSLQEKGSLLAAGPYDDLTGGMILLQADDLAGAESLVAADPYTKADVTRDRQVRAWRVTVGSVG